ncbi:HNH endonuclease [Hoeflea olei]|uniref:HNH endonuclease n=1 Tax=Hoeflea olei TaxID=1480615 RepID=UPI0011119C3D|nr:HNH endonuclease [Hoeflea olei]
MAKNSRIEIHPSIKSALGYDIADSDENVLLDWKDRTSRVCKPCWELKYCPYGPLVEDSPIIPPLREGMIEHIEYFQECLKSGLVGTVDELTQETRDQLRRWVSDDQILLHQARNTLIQRATLEAASEASSDDEKIEKWLGGRLPPIHIYRTAYEIDDRDIKESDYPSDVWSELRAEAAAIKVKHLEALKSGKSDNRSPLEPARRAWFEDRVRNFDPADYPDAVPETFSNGECNVFGHICPVFFAAEALTETSTERRRGRYIPFKVKIRVVRRDNYTCQHCSTHLKDDEVEFDHIIPISRGGSSEEQNIRLTCFDCNRDKSDDYVP